LRGAARFEKHKDNAEAQRSQRGAESSAMGKSGGELPRSKVVV